MVAKEYSVRGNEARIMHMGVQCAFCGSTSVNLATITCNDCGTTAPNIQRQKAKKKKQQQKDAQDAVLSEGD